MNRDQPPCSSCSKHECRACAWTSPLDASYRTLLGSQSLLSEVEEPISPEPSWFASASKRVAKLIVEWTSPRAR